MDEQNEDLHKISTDKTGFDVDPEAYAAWVKANKIPTPSPKQARWLDAEIGMFCHFSINTFHDLEWSDGTLDPATFNPTELDCDQWVTVAKDLGAGYMVLTAKHHDGFCLWPTETTDYSVKSSPYKDGNGDVVREFLDACRRAAMPAGLYLSPWDRHEPCYPDKDAYDEFYARQLTELLTWYNTKYTELWFDGAGSTGREYDWKTISEIIKKHQPQAVVFNMGQPDIRWAGNENGTATYPLWNVVSRDDYPGLKDGKPEYFWFPAECDKPIRYHTWFYNTANELVVSDLDELASSYIQSVGRGANLILNIAPDRRGLIPDADWEAAKEFGSTMKSLFARPLASTRGEGDEIVLNLGKTNSPARVNCLVIQEDIATKGQRVKAYAVEKDENGSDEWETVLQGSSIGHKKIDLFSPVQATRLRIRVSDTWAKPSFKQVSAFSSPLFDQFREYMNDDRI
jgi:alpha-L-fucosidase